MVIGWNLTMLEVTSDGCVYKGNTSLIHSACPSHGSFIGWKACRDGKIVKLEIPEEAKRCSGLGRKCRASKAKVLAIYGAMSDVPLDEEARSGYDESFVYRVGDVVEPKEAFEENRFDECSSGIHFYLTRVEAELENVLKNLAQEEISKIENLK